MKITLLFLSLLIAMVAHGSSYYVKNDGNDSNTGLSDNQAWKTIARVNGHNFNAGDSILFKRGHTWREGIIVSNSGTAGSFITYSAYGSGENPVINGSDVTTGWNQYSAKIWKASCASVTNYLGLGYDYVVIADGVMYTQVGTLADVNIPNTYFINRTPDPDEVYIYTDVNPGTKLVEVSARMFGIFINTKTFIKVSGLEFRNAGHSGAYFYGGKSIDGHSIVDNCNFYRNRVTGVELYGGYSNSLIQNCTSTYNGNGYYSASYAAFGSNGNIFRNCYAGYIHRYIVGLVTDGHGFGIYNSGDCIVEYSEAEHCHFGIIIDANSQAYNFTCRYNYVHDTEPEESGIAVGGNIPAGTVHQVYNNLIVNTGNGSRLPYAIAIGGTSRKGTVNVLNNTIYQDGSGEHSGSGIISSNGYNLTIKNNIIYSNAGNAHLMILQGGSGFACDYNCYYAPRDANNIFSYNDINYHTLSAWKSATGLDIHSIYGDPLFENTNSVWKIRTGSPAINSGTNVGLSQDISGNPIEGAPDMGAFEYQIPDVDEINNPPEINNQEFKVNLDEISDNYIGRITASDPDAGQDIRLTIIGGNESNLFNIDILGDLKISSNNYDGYLADYSLIIKAEDNGKVMKSDTAIITITFERIVMNLSVFPNPSNGKFGIYFENPAQQVLNLNIVDVTGRTIYDRPFNPENPEMLNQVDISNEPKGSYFIILRTDLKIYSKQIVIN